MGAWPWNTLNVTLTTFLHKVALTRSARPMSKVTTFWLRDLAWVYGAKRVKDHCPKSDSSWIGTCYVDCDCGGGCASCQTGSQRSLSGTAPGWDGAVPVGSEANLTNDTYQSWNHGIRRSQREMAATWWLSILFTFSGMRNIYIWSHIATLQDYINERDLWGVPGWKECPDSAG